MNGPFPSISKQRPSTKTVVGLARSRHTGTQQHSPAARQRQLLSTRTPGARPAYSSICVTCHSPAYALTLDGSWPTCSCTATTELSNVDKLIVPCRGRLRGVPRDLSCAMTSPLPFMLPLPQQSRRSQRDDDYFSSSRQPAAASRHARDSSMERTSSLDPRLRDGESLASPAALVPQRQLVCPDPLAFR